MNFEFSDDNIMLVTDCEEPGPDEGPEEGSRWSMYFDGASNALGNGIGVVIIFLRTVILHSPPDYVSTAPTTWQSMKHVSWVFELLLT